MLVNLISQYCRKFTACLTVFFQRNITIKAALDYVESNNNVHL